MKYVGGKNLSEKIGTGSDAGLANDNVNIDWNDFNYPPCLKIFHYSGDEIPTVHSKKVLMWKINHILIILTNVVNFITNIVATAQDSFNPSSIGGMRIALSIFIFIFWLPLSFYLFILPYQILMKGKGSTIIFYILTIVTFIFYFIWSIANFADANGFVKIGEYKDLGKNGAVFFSVLSSIMSLAISLLAILNGYLFYSR